MSKEGILSIASTNEMHYAWQADVRRSIFSPFRPGVVSFKISGSGSVEHGHLQLAQSLLDVLLPEATFLSAVLRNLARYPHMQGGISFVIFQQFRMRSPGCDPPLFQHDDLVHPVQIS